MLIRLTRHPFLVGADSLWAPIPIVLGSVVFSFEEEGNLSVSRPILGSLKTINE
jgi:hypothetical protein